MDEETRLEANALTASRKAEEQRQAGTLTRFVSLQCAAYVYAYAGFWNARVLETGASEDVIQWDFWTRAGVAWEEEANRCQV